MSAVDPITAQVVRESMESVSTEMSRVVERTAVHPLFNECHDYSTGVFHHRESVSLVARATAIPVHIFASLKSVEAMLERHGSTLVDGDVVLLNDPYLGGTHNADLTVMKPVFLEGGGLLCPAVRAHMADSGGALAGNYNPDAREVWQEAFRIPPVKIVEAGELREDVRAAILANTRIPEVFDGDLRAMMAACDIGEQRIRELCERYGDAVVEACVDEAFAYSERRFRAEVATWPNGRRTGVMRLDHDAAGNRDIVVQATVEVSDDGLVIDFEGSSPQTPGFVNSPLGNTASWVYVAICATLGDDIPINSGLFRVVDIRAPLGSVVNPISPAPVMSSTGRTGSEVGTSVMKALEQIVPERCGNVAYGGTLCTTYGVDPRYDEFFVTIEYGSNLVSASGAHGTDGWGGWPTPFSTLVFNTIEMLEIQFPYRYHRYEYTTDTAAPGRWRGVPGFAMEREAVSDQYVNAIVVGARNVAPGWAGGDPGFPNRIWLRAGDPDEELIDERVTRAPIAAGQRMASLRSGGGGFGPAFERDPRAVLDDVLDEIYTIAVAEQAFGVVIDPATLEIDEEATAARRGCGRTEHGVAATGGDSDWRMGA
ncbi:MAG: hydantoinase B/oxoprolinase family protein [Solirubrobacteraceae bacterium]